MKANLIISFLFTMSLNNGTAQNATSSVGVQLYSFREQMKIDVAKTMAQISAMGIKSVEGAGYFGLSASEFRKIADANNIKIEGVSADFAELEDEVKLNKIISDAIISGANYVACFWIPHVEGDFTFAETQKGIEVFNKAGKILSKHNLILIYHPHGFEFKPYENEYMLDLLIKNTNAKHVNFEMDLNWIYHAGHNPVAWLEKYPKRWIALHIKDREKGTAGNQFGRMDVEKNVVIGDGEVNIDASMKMARKIGVKFYFIEDESSRSMEQVPRGITYLRKFFK
jgi:sugar phosphate isomerase/epimerase